MMRWVLPRVLLPLICMSVWGCHRPQPEPPAESPSFLAHERPAPRVLIVAETGGPGGAAAAESASALDTLVGHFEETCAIVSAAHYGEGRLRDYPYAFYLAGKRNARARTSFAADLSRYEGTAVWVGPGLEEIGEAALTGLGLAVAAGNDTLAGPAEWTISYRDQRHVERLHVPAAKTVEGANVLAEARHGGERRPFLAGREHLWYAATGPALEGERFWSACIWADALHEILARPHEGRPRRLVCVLRDVPVWASAEQAPRAIRPMLEAGVPVGILTRTNSGDVPLADRPDAVAGLRAAESLGATMALVTDTEVNAEEHLRLAWEVGIHPVAWAGPDEGSNPFRLRIADPGDSPPYCAGGLLPAPIAISDAGYIAPKDADRLEMQEVVRDGTALVSFGLWAPPEPYLEFVRSRTANGWETADLRDFGVRVDAPRRRMASGEATVRVASGAPIRKTIFGPRWQIVEQELLPSSDSGWTAHEVETPVRSVAMLEMLRGMRPGRFIKGVTLDPGTYSHSGLSAQALAEMLAERYAETGVNTVFFYAYNVDEGAGYRARYGGASVSEWGRKDLLAHVLAACHARDIKVVAWMYSGRDRRMWQRHPEWRERARDGKAHNPLRLHAAYFLCPRNPEVQRWYAGLLRDLGRRYPTLDGIEVCEPVVNWFGDQACYCDVCRGEFAAAHPGEELAGEVWRRFRAEGLTEFLSTCMEAISEQGIDGYIMTISDAWSNGAILSSRRQAEESGFDLDAVLDGPHPPDWVNFEIIWQQWAEIYGPEIFNTDWAAETARRLVRRTDGRARVVLHMEMTDFGSQRMTAADIAEGIERVRAARPDGIECYHSGAIDRKGAWAVLRRSYEELP